MRTITPEALASTISALPVTEPRVVTSGNLATPFALLDVVDAALATYRLFILNAHEGIPVRDGVTLETPFVGAGMRDQPSLDYIPSRLSMVPLLFRTTKRPDVVLLHTTAPANGLVSLGVEVNILPAAIEAAHTRGALVVAQVNPRMPWTYGDAQVPVESIDFGVEIEADIPAHAGPSVDDASRVIADRVAHLVVDGATLQTGIGAVPNAALAGLTKRRGLRVWSEMFSDGVVDLERQGCLDPDDPITASFCFGSEEVYRFVDRNPRVRMLRTEKTNDPGLIAAHHDMVSLNSALQVDLFAQANASRRGGRIYSGFGGQTDFIVGAMHAARGLAIIALSSWHAKTSTSTIVPLLDVPVTSFQQTHIATEQGISAIWGLDQTDQARRLIHEVAHPDAREELASAAAEMGLC